MSEDKPLSEKKRLAEFFERLEKQMQESANRPQVFIVSLEEFNRRLKEFEDLEKTK